MEAEGGNKFRLGDSGRRIDDMLAEEFGRAVGIGAAGSSEAVDVVAEAGSIAVGVVEEVEAFRMDEDSPDTPPCNLDMVAAAFARPDTHFAAGIAHEAILGIVEADGSVAVAELLS